MRTSILNDFLVLISVTAIAALALLFASRSSWVEERASNDSVGCAGDEFDLAALEQSDDARSQVIRLTPPGSVKQKDFRVENRPRGGAPMSLVSHPGVSESDASALRSSGLYEEMGLRIRNVQVCYKSHIGDGSHGQMRLGFDVGTKDNLAYVSNVAIMEGSSGNKHFDRCIVDIFDGMVFMPPLDEVELPPTGAVMVFYPVEVL